MRFSDSHVGADYVRMQPGRKLSWLRLVDASLTNPGMLACWLFRIQSFLVNHHLTRLAGCVRLLNNSWTGADILPGCTVGQGLLLPHPTGLVVGHGVVIGEGCTLLQGVTLGEKFADGRPPHEYPVIGNGVVIGAGAVVLGNVKIGDGASIAANAVVLTDIPSGSVAAGCPAKVIRTRTSAKVTAP